VSGGRPFTARRRRRCEAGRLCPQGGVIRPGQQAIRAKRHVYIHADDVAPLTAQLAAAMALVTSAAEVAGDLLMGLVRTVLTWWENVSPMLAQEVRADVVDRCWERPVAVAATDRPLTVRLVADGDLPRDEASHQLWRAARALEADGFTVAWGSTEEGIEVTWTKYVDEVEEPACLT
jgi:hypothetical protein